MNTAPDSGNGNSRILIVDDNSAFTRHVSEFLQNTHRYVVCEEMTLAAHWKRRGASTPISFFSI
jgi:PleD family two-component response regulator